DGASRAGYDDFSSGHCANVCGADSPTDWHGNDQAVFLVGALKGLPDNSAGVIRLDDVLHLVDQPVLLMKELHRVLSHGGFLLTSTPSTDGRGAWQDPGAKSYWNQNSFWYWTDPVHQRRIGVSCPWQDVCTNTWFPSDWHREVNMPYVVAHMLALKDGPRFHGLNSFDGVDWSAYGPDQRRSDGRSKWAIIESKRDRSGEEASGGARKVVARH
ncbi:MAG TPA: methyltransferase domain-containing protein, partial [Blastocatellia bacterium]|nr:methyltransferase domain-containing protein [Blastocatellia bacterium]